MVLQTKTLNYARVCRVILHNREIRKYLRRNIVELYLCFKQPIHLALNCVDGGGGRLVRCAICRAARGGRRVRGHVCHLQRAVLQQRACSGHVAPGHQHCSPPHCETQLVTCHQPLLTHLCLLLYLYVDNNTNSSTFFVTIYNLSLDKLSILSTDPFIYNRHWKGYSISIYSIQYWSSQLQALLVCAGGCVRGGGGPRLGDPAPDPPGGPEPQPGHPGPGLPPLLPLLQGARRPGRGGALPAPTQTWRRAHQVSCQWQGQ